MDFNKHKTNKFIKKNNIDEEHIPKNESTKLLTNIQALELGEFPENLIEKVNLPEMANENYIDTEIKPKHSEILEGRPMPKMLDNSKLIENLKKVESPALGKFYEEKKTDETMDKEKYPNKR